MAKRKSPPATEEHQIPLIDVVHPMHKPFKALKKKINTNDDEASAVRETAKNLRFEMIELFKAHDIKPDADGVRRIEFDGQIIEVSPGESKLHFRNKPKPKTPDPSDGESGDGDDTD